MYNTVGVGGDIVIYGNLDHMCLDGEAFPLSNTGKFQDEFSLVKKKTRKRNVSNTRLNCLK